MLEAARLVAVMEKAFAAAEHEGKSQSRNSSMRWWSSSVLNSWPLP
jgi:hypothetical protein